MSVEAAHDTFTWLQLAAEALMPVGTDGAVVSGNVVLVLLVVVVGALVVVVVGTVLVVVGAVLVVVGGAVLVVVVVVVDGVGHADAINPSAATSAKRIPPLRIPKTPTLGQALGIMRTRPGCKAGTSGGMQSPCHAGGFVAQGRERFGHGNVRSDGV